MSAGKLSSVCSLVHKGDVCTWYLLQNTELSTQNFPIPVWEDFKNHCALWRLFPRIKPFSWMFCTEPVDQRIECHLAVYPRYRMIRSVPYSFIPIHPFFIEIQHISFTGKPTKYHTALHQAQVPTSNDITKQNYLLTSWQILSFLVSCIHRHLFQFLVVQLTFVLVFH